MECRLKHAHFSQFFLLFWHRNPLFHLSLLRWFAEVAYICTAACFSHVMVNTCLPESQKVTLQTHPGVGPVCAVSRTSAALLGPCQNTATALLSKNGESSITLPAEGGKSCFTKFFFRVRCGGYNRQDGTAQLRQRG